MPGAINALSARLIEAMGFDGPDVDAEIIIMSARMWRRLGISKLKLEINSLGSPESRHRHREAGAVDGADRHEQSRQH